MINPNILKKLDFFDINKADGLTYLLSLYHNLTPSYIPDLVKKKVNQTGIIERDYTTGAVNWTVPLYSNEPVEDYSTTWDWINSEYRALFMRLRPNAGGDKKGCLQKMKRFFAENPEVRKQDVLTAAKAYLDEFITGASDLKYMQRADYFISKAAPGSKSSRLSQYIEITKTSQTKVMKGLMNKQETI